MKQIIISSIALFVLSMVLGGVVHGMFLAQDYLDSDLMRSETDQQAKFGFMLAAHAMISVGFTLIYRKGREDKPALGQGIRFGALWALGCSIPIYMIYYAVMPFKLDLTIKQAALDGIAIILMGIAAAFLNRK